MNDYTPEGMLKRIEVLEEENRQMRIVFDLHQQTLDNLIDYLEKHKPRFESLEKAVGNYLKGNY